MGLARISLAVCTFLILAAQPDPANAANAPARKGARPPVAAVRQQVPSYAVPPVVVANPIPRSEAAIDMLRHCKALIPKTLAYERTIKYGPGINDPGGVKSEAELRDRLVWEVVRTLGVDLRNLDNWISNGRKEIQTPPYGPGPLVSTKLSLCFNERRRDQMLGYVSALPNPQLKTYSANSQSRPPKP